MRFAAYTLALLAVLVAGSVLYGQYQRMAALEAARTVPDGRVMGNPRADLTIVEFVDYNCPYCAQGHETLSLALKGREDVRLVIRQLPLLGEDSLEAARFALAAAGQDAYVPYHNALIAAKGKIDRRRALEIAEELGLDVARLTADADSEETLAKLGETYSDAVNIGVESVPTYLIGRILYMPEGRMPEIADFNTMIEQAKR